MEEKKTICIIHGEVVEEYIDEHILGVQKRANELGYRTVTYSMLCADTLGTNNEESVYSYIDYNEYAGVVFDEYSFVAHPHIAHHVATDLKKNCKLPKVVLGSSDVSKDCFYNDSEADFEAITDHLITAHECTKIYFLGGSPADKKHRVKGFQNSIKKHGLDPEECVAIYGGYWVDCAEKFVKDLVNEVIEKPEAVVCVTDIVADALIKECLNMGIRVPEDLRVCGYNGHSCALNNLLPITTFPVNVKETGERAMNRLHELITGDALILRRKPSQALILGRSCGCSPIPPSNVRFKLAEVNKTRDLQRAFMNSMMEENLVLAQSVDEMRIILRDATYLIPNAEFFSWNVVHSDASVECHFISKYMVYDSAPMENGKLFPEHIRIPEEVLNCYVVPLVYAGKVLGFAVVGYTTPALFDHNLKRFCHCLALGTMLLNEREPVVENKVEEYIEEPVAEPEQKPEKECFDTRTNTIFGKKQDMMHKLKIDNILYFEAMGKQVLAVTANGEYEVTPRLCELEKSMEEMQFFRVSKSILVNMNRVTLIREEEDRSVSAHFTPQIGVRVSRSYVKEFRNKVGVSQNN